MSTSGPCARQVEDSKTTSFQVTGSSGGAFPQPDAGNRPIAVEGLCGYGAGLAACAFDQRVACLPSSMRRAKSVPRAAHASLDEGCRLSTRWVDPGQWIARAFICAMTSITSKPSHQGAIMASLLRIVRLVSGEPEPLPPRSFTPRLQACSKVAKRPPQKTAPFPGIGM